ncbi:MAG: GNAT family N-acetyltransferase [Sphingobacteriia bacterium]|nr:GNAT family N-acetyltransferase [Sphingobacteriia bacterium]
MKETVKKLIHERFNNNGYVIITEKQKLYCRPFNPNDIDLIKEIYSDLKCRILLVGDENRSEQQLTEWIDNVISRYKDCGLSFYVVCKKEEKLGIVGLGEFNIDPETKLSYTSIHYAFPVRSHKKGYCSEICEELVRFVVKDLNIDCIHAQTLSYNKVSQLILRRLGFEPNGKQNCPDNYKDEYVTKFLLTHESYKQALMKEKISVNSKLHDNSRDFRKLIKKDYKKWYRNREDVKSNAIFYKRIINYLNLTSPSGSIKNL